MEAGADHNGPGIHSLPTELLTKVASCLAPTLRQDWKSQWRGHQFEEWQEQHTTITSLQLTSRLFAAICRPFVWRTLCFSADDTLDNGPATLMELNDVRPLVKELRWEAKDTYYNDMSPVFLPLLTNLTSFAVLWREEYPDYPVQIPRSMTKALKSLPNLSNLQLEDVTGFGDESFDLNAKLPHLKRLTLSSCWEYEEGIVFQTPAQEFRYILDRSIDLGNDSIDRYLVLSEALSVVKSLVLEGYYQDAVPQDWVGVGALASTAILRDYTPKERKGFPLERLVLYGPALFCTTNDTSLLLDTLAETSALHSLSILDSPRVKATEVGLIDSWKSLRMPHIQSLTISMTKPPTEPLPLRALLASFPNLDILDISNVLRPRVLLSSPLDTLAGTPAEVLMLLKYAREETTIQHLTIRFPKRNEILRCRRVGEGEEEEKGSYGWARELWREW